MGEEIKARKPHVLIFPYPGQGHINPMLQFAKRLVSKGVKATLVTTVYLSKSSFAHPSTSIDLQTNPMASTKKLSNNGHPIHALVYDGFLPWALDVAKPFGIPSAVFFTQSCAVNSVYYHLPLPGPDVSLPRLPRLQVSELPSLVCLYGSYPAWFDVVVSQFSNVDGADWDQPFHLCIWTKDLKTTDYGMNLFKPKTIACLSWLSGKPKGSVVYVSFGSFTSLGFEQMAEIAWALKGSYCYFLWVVREKEEAKLPNNFIDETRDKGLVVSWCPQLEVLSHESIGCFLTHCGFNSVLEALSLGVPMLAMPQWTDQGTNAKFVEDVWGIGIRVGVDEKGLVRREVIEQCVKEIMEGEKGKEAKNNAIKWKDLAKKAVEEGGTSDKNMDDFVAKLHCD
ncbi:hypothetical protein DITRI_Ditri11bG0054500 [Diplodiscus trichospermus]